MAFVAVLVECHHGRKGQRRAFKTDHEQQEVACGNHKVHAEKRDEQQLVKLAAANAHVLGAGPRHALYEHNHGTYVENALDGCDYRRCGIHAGESFAGTCRAEAVRAETCCCGQQQKHCADYGQSLAGTLRHECVVKEYEQENDQEGEFLFHDQKL